jgi:tRNA A-37 threonylcarbamoyl transferase component Bud32
MAPKFLAAGKQGCVYNGEFDTIKGKQGCESVRENGTVQKITKIMKDAKAYDNEMAAARVLAKKDPDNRRTVYATRGCEIRIQDVFENEEDLKECNEMKEIATDKLKREEGGFSIEMPYIQHIPLEDAKVSSIYLETGVRLFQELEQCIVQLQEWGIYHKDLHPGNIWLIGEGESLMIADFGCATVLQPNQREFLKEEVKKDIKTSAPSFAKLWAMIDRNKRPRDIEPKDIKNYIENRKSFYNLPSLEDLQAKQTPQEDYDIPSFSLSTGRKRLAFE